MSNNDIRALLKTLTEECSLLYSDPLLCQQYAWWLLEAVSGQSQTDLLVKKTIDLSQAQSKQLRLWIDALVNDKKPLAYILGWMPFLDLKIMVKPPLLIPRPETEEWVSYLIDVLRPQAQQTLSILDLCSGTGCVGLAIAKAYPEWVVTMIDINPIAIEVATENARMNGIENIKVIESDLFDNIEGKTFDLIVTNPPYISEQEFKTLDESVKLWEDYKALVADNNGLAIIEKIIEQAPTYLNERNCIQAIGNLWIEIGYQQAAAVGQCMKSHAYTKVRNYTDMSKKERVVIGTYEALSPSSAHHASD